MAKSSKTTRPRAYSVVSAKPVKSFFVEMLTRDISLHDAILDLLDNCVDGILRARGRRATGSKPYKDSQACITFTPDEFTISDNCGGIPWSQHEYAFRMGRAEARQQLTAPTVGVYGIGMKRAIFKIGRHSLIQTQNRHDAYDVEITADWLRKEDDWSLPVRPSDSPMPEDGTTIYVSELNDGVRSLFGSDAELFEKELLSRIATHYAFIIDKGFTVEVNGEPVSPRPTKLRFESPEKQKKGKDAIRPYIYEGSIEGVDVFLAVGLTFPIPSMADIEAEQEKKQYSSLDAGWTVICNDRAVVYCDRTELTGWGEAGVPKYHTQFVAISGLVEFRSNNASLLPTTTTKRGIDASSRLYLQVKNKMREGLQMFTDFTNKWKGRDLAKQAQDRIREANPTSLQELKKLSLTVQMQKLSRTIPGRQYKPKLPMPVLLKAESQQISFSRKREAIQCVAEFLFDNARTNPNDVGAKCFDRVLREAKS